MVVGEVRGQDKEVRGGTGSAFNTVAELLLQSTHLAFLFLFIAVPFLLLSCSEEKDSTF